MCLRVLITTFISLRGFLICLGSISSHLLFSLALCSSENLWPLGPAPLPVCQARKLILLIRFYSSFSCPLKSHFLGEAALMVHTGGILWGTSPSTPCPLSTLLHSSVYTFIPLCVSHCTVSFMKPGPHVSAISHNAWHMVMFNEY